MEIKRYWRKHHERVIPPAPNVPASNMPEKGMFIKGMPAPISGNEPVQKMSTNVNAISMNGNINAVNLKDAIYKSMLEQKKDTPLSKAMNKEMSIFKKASKNMQETTKYVKSKDRVHDFDDERATNSNVAFKLHEDAEDKYRFTNDGKLKDRHKRAFNTIIQKLSEDNAYECEGDDEWDIPEIMKRRVNKRVMTACKTSFLKHHIIIIFDTSTSCQKMSALYIALCEYAQRIGCLEIFQAPNGYILSSFDKLMTENAIGNSTLYHDKYFRYNKHRNGYEWNLHGRTIIFFGDYDGTAYVVNASHNNAIHWFNPSTDLSNRFKYNDNRVPSGFRGKLYRCTNVEDILEIASRMRI